MALDDVILAVALIVFISLTLVLLIRVDWHDWGLVGLLITAGAVTCVLLLSNLNRILSPETPAMDVPGYEALLWSWRAGAMLGGATVLTGLVIEFHRNPPFFHLAVRRISGGLLLVGFVALGFWLFS